MMSFIVDPRIATTCFELGDWTLSRIFLKNNADFPWLILVPRQDNINDIHQLPQNLQYTLMDEISRLSAIVDDYFKPDKLNVATLGNIVSQLHIHVVARFTHDKLWPHGIWQDGFHALPYKDDVLQSLIKELQHKVQFYRMVVNS